MAGTTFAAIDVGSYQVEMVIYEINSRGIRQLDHVRHIIALGKDAYNDRKISYGLIDELCDILFDFKDIMKTYDVKSCRACATSAIRESKNARSILDRIKMKTEIEVEILSNSEQRLIIYEAVASQKEGFQNLIDKGVALADVGAGSAQVSLFDKGSLVTTQNLKLGALRLMEVLYHVTDRSVNTYSMMEEYIDTDMEALSHLFIKDQDIECLILVGDSINWLLNRLSRDHKRESSIYTKQEFLEIYHDLYFSKEELGRRLGVSHELSDVILPSAMIYKKILDTTQADTLWIPGIRLCDGMAAEFARTEKKRSIYEHDFTADIIGAAKNISKRYSWNKEHVQFVEKMALKLFDSLRKYHGLGKRERLLLQIACILHDCGQYISMLYPEECSYNIIMSTEIIGLSHIEREMVANIVKYTTLDVDMDNDMDLHFSSEIFLTITKLTAILKVSNALDRGHKQKFKNTAFQIKGRNLGIITRTNEDISLEKGMINDKTGLFEEVYGLKLNIILRKVQEV